MDWIGRHPFIIVVVFLAILIPVVFAVAPSRQERLKRDTHIVTKTLPDGRQISCVIYHQAISCNWPK